MIILLIVIVVVIVVIFLFTQQASFGKIPKGERLVKIKKSPNYKNGNFKNQSYTAMMAENASYLKLLKQYIWRKNPTTPDIILPFVTTDLKSESTINKPTLTWFGHSSYLIQLKNKNILVDPVFSKRVSPVQYAGSKQYEGSGTYNLDDLPKIDFVIITHDHYDHLDFDTIKKLKSQNIIFYTPLGVGAHLEAWGISANKIHELDWWESININTEIKLIATPARHFSGRGITNRNTTLWASYALITPDHKIYIGGDSGYDKHFKEIGDKLGPFDLVILEAGQYHEFWPHIHMMPEEVVKAAINLKGKVLLPVHWGKFTLALHTWDDPIRRVKKAADEMKIKITTPMNGERIIIDSLYPDKEWWKK